MQAGITYKVVLVRKINGNVLCVKRELVVTNNLILQLVLVLGTGLFCEIYLRRYLHIQH